VNQKTLLIFSLSDNIYRIIVEVEDFTPEEDLDQINRELTVQDFERHARACLHPGTKFNVVESLWLTCIRFNERRAERYIHKDRIFLAGDSAHVHSPAGGQGMNTGLQDAYNLAWKLALVLNKLAPPRLLQSYQEERMPMADRAIALSSKLLAGDRDQGTVWHFFRMLFLMLSPLLVYINSTAFPRLVNMVL
jgi:2-polyprenyl-6-methoxyphenol hydroxylase-like FAD-dependent oxidoreductase